MRKRKSPALRAYERIARSGRRGAEIEAIAKATGQGRGSTHQLVSVMMSLGLVRSERFVRPGQRGWKARYKAAGRVEEI